MHSCLAKKWAHTHTYLNRDNLPLYSSCSYSRNILYRHTFYLQLVFFNHSQSDSEWDIMLPSSEIWGICSFFLCKWAGCRTRGWYRKELSDGAGCTHSCGKAYFSIAQWSFFLVLMASLGLCWLHDSNMWTICYSSKATWHDYPKKE